MLVCLSFDWGIRTYCELQPQWANVQILEHRDRFQWSEHLVISRQISVRPGSTVCVHNGWQIHKCSIILCNLNINCFLKCFTWIGESSCCFKCGSVLYCRNVTCSIIKEVWGTAALSISFPAQSCIYMGNKKICFVSLEQYYLFHILFQKYLFCMLIAPHLLWRQD